MNLFFNWYESQKNNLHPIILASEAHLKILEINPFTNGNLQMANLILNWILIQYNYTYISPEENQKNREKIRSVLEQYHLRFFFVFHRGTVHQNYLTASANVSGPRI